MFEVTRAAEREEIQSLPDWGRATTPEVPGTYRDAVVQRLDIHDAHAAVVLEEGCGVEWFGFVIM